MQPIRFETAPGARPASSLPPLVHARVVHARAPDRWPLHRATSRGLTLVELVITITLIGVLTAAISIGVIGAQKRANVQAAKTACNTARQATMQWKAVHPAEDCPTVDQLKTEKDLDTGFNVKDPWGNLYKLSCDADEITCTSAGPDRKESTDDDIHVPQVDTPTGGK